MKRFAIVYLSTLVVLLPLDFLFLGAIGKKLFADHVGDMTLANPRVAPAILFYVLYLAGVTIFVNGGATGRRSSTSKPPIVSVSASCSLVSGGLQNSRNQDSIESCSSARARCMPAQ